MMLCKQKKAKANIIMFYISFYLSFYLILQYLKKNLKMHEQNNQNTEKRQFLFSLIHSKTKYDFIGSWKITHTRFSSSYLCQIYPLNINSQFIRIDTHSLKIQLNRLLLQSNPHFSSTGFKFKLHPIKGIFFLQCSYISHIHINDLLIIKQQLQNFQNQIIFQLTNSKTIKTIISKIMNLKESGSIIPNKKNCFSQILKFTYNSSFYGWVSSKGEKSTNLSGSNQCEKQNAKAEIWSDCSSESEQQWSDKQNQTEQSFTNNIFSKKEQKNQHFSDFYSHYRSEYEKISAFGENQIKNHNMLKEQGSQVGKLVVKYFMSQQDDLILYKKYLMKHVQATHQSSQKCITNSKFTQKECGISMLYSKFYKQTFNKTTQPEQQQSNLTTFIESNQLTLSKSSKWKILIDIISTVYQDFIKNKSQQKNHYLDMRVYHIKRNLQTTLKQKHNQMIHLFRPSIEKSQQQPTSFINSYAQFQENFQKQEFAHKHIAEIMLNIACFICVPEVKFINRRFNKADEFLNNMKQKCFNEKFMRKLLSMEGQYSKFKSTNLQVECILLYLQQRAMKFNQAPFADWVMIMCEYMNGVFQENESLVG